MWWKENVSRCSKKVYGESSGAEPPPYGLY